MTMRDYQEIVSHMDSLAIVIDLAQRQLHALRTRVETIADRDGLLPQGHLPFADVDSLKGPAA